MKHQYSFGRIWQAETPAVEPAMLAMTYPAAREARLTVRQRAERLYLMGELAAAADLLAKETIQ